MIYILNLDQLVRCFTPILEHPNNTPNLLYYTRFVTFMMGRIGGDSQVTSVRGTECLQHRDYFTT